MKRAAVVRLQDMLEVIDAVTGLMDGADLGAYRRDLKLRLAVERCVEIVSEASRHVPPEAKAAFPEVPWPEIAAVGNKLRHEYGRIDDAILWKIATRSLPDLRPVVVALLESATRDGA